MQDGAEYFKNFQPAGTYFTPDPTANIPYPVRHRLTQGLLGSVDLGKLTPGQLNMFSQSTPAPGDENRGQYTETPATLDAQRASSSAPTTSKSSGAGGSLPSTSSMPDASQLQAIMRSF